MFQLTKEFSALMVLAPLSASNKIQRQETQLAYELTWSRFDILLTAKEADSFMSIEGARPFFSQLFERFSKLEELVFALHSEQQAVELTKQLDAIYKELLGYMNHNFRIKNPFYQEQTEQVKLLDQTQIGLMLLLFSCAALVGYILHLESEANKQLAMTDSLTQIPNRLAMAQDINQHIEQHQPFTLCLLDLNGFKQINDRYGHQAGDRALQTLAARFMSSNNSQYFSSYRIGGDEFALVLRQQDSNQMEHALNCALDCFNQEIEIAEGTFYGLSASVGLATYPNQANCYSDLIKIADKNMYQMKFATRTHSRQT
ncbi:transcriptional regulator CdgA [Vibrio ponticus]|nr:transcriptional regulator CdgA [Vibrio ponticus]